MNFEMFLVVFGKIILFVVIIVLCIVVGGVLLLFVLFFLDELFFLLVDLVVGGLNWVSDMVLLVMLRLVSMVSVFCCVSCIWWELG